ncbi:UPF0187-domain-containing protein [Ramaria rubella]|nr:UPF0187-domain-containing protein [Ramaria rubella]
MPVNIASSGPHWSMKKFNATVINDIWPETFFFTLISTMVAAVTQLTPHKLQISNALLTVLGTVLGLVISFRTSSAYERYQEGRKLWTSVTLASRNIAQMIWIHVSVDRQSSGETDEAKIKADRLKVIIEKRSMINLVQAFSVAVKHFLRAEPGIYYEDLYPLVSFLPRHHIHPTSEPTVHDILPIWSEHEKLSQSPRGSPTPTPSLTLTSKKHKYRNDSFDPEKALPRVNSDVPLRGARNPPKPTVYDYVPLLLIFKPIFSGPKWVYRRLFKRREDYSLDPEAISGRSLTGKKRPPPPIDSNVPLEITLFLQSYLQFLLQKPGVLQPAIASGLVTNLFSLQDTVTSLERVRNTPIPFAYQAHLRLSLWLYLLFLPFQIVSTMNWFTIPATCFAAFLLLGFLEIGQEIENPFNYDENDLDMDSFCLAIQRELHEITAHPAPDPYTYIFTGDNQPFAPIDCRSAEEIVNDVGHEYHGDHKGMDSIRRTLLRNWRQVEEVTRDGY